MNYIRLLLEKLFPSSRIVEETKNVAKTTEDDIDKYLCGISFYLTDKYEIDVSGFVPNMEEIDVDDITNISEKYAQLLLSVNKGFLKDKILEILTERARTTDNTNEQLFINNVIVFYGLLKDELSKLQNSKYPLIRPTNVFRSK